MSRFNGLVMGVLGVVVAALAPHALNAQAGTSSDSIGEVHFAISCGDEAQRRFDRAVALLHHMTYFGAREEFSSIATAHPDCAMAHWGFAMTLFQPLWPVRPTPEDLERGRQAISRAGQIESTTARERMFIAATAAFFDPGATEYWQRIERWAEGMRDAYEAYPEDVETRAFFALSLLATAPPSGDLTQNATAAAVLETVLQTKPTHPGAVHYTIHANDAIGREAKSLGVVRRYGGIAPRNAHALHMPTHIYVRLGEWSGVIEGNQQAAEAAFETRVGDRMQWVWDEFPHALEYVVYGFLQIGDDSAALAAMTRLEQTRDLQPSFKTAFHLASIPARYALERRDWEGAAALSPRPDSTLPWDRFPWPEAVTWFARGIGAVRTGNVQAGREAEARLAGLRDASDRMGEELFERQTEILRLGVAAWLAHAQADTAQSLELMQQAVDLEARTPKHAVTPAPTLPAAELLGDLLLELNRPEAALEAYRSSLESSPGRFNSLAGAARSADRVGDATLARTYYRQLKETAAPDSRRKELAEAVAFLERRSSRAGPRATGSGRGVVPSTDIPHIFRTEESTR